MAITEISKTTLSGKFVRASKFNPKVSLWQLTNERNLGEFGYSGRAIAFEYKDGIFILDEQAFPRFYLDGIEHLSYCVLSGRKGRLYLPNPGEGEKYVTQKAFGELFSYDEFLTFFKSVDQGHGYVLQYCDLGNNSKGSL